MGITLGGGLRRRILVVGTVGLSLATVLGLGAAQANTEPSAAPYATSTTPVSYSCFVTFPGASTTVPFSLSYTGTAPDTAAPRTSFTATLDAPVITPRTDLNQQVQDVRVVYRVPDNAYLLGFRQSGGSGLGPDGAKVHREGNSVIVTAAGPLLAGQPFQLPTVTLYLVAVASGSASVSQGGITLADPAFSWVRTDLGGALRPFACFAAAPVPLTTTTVTSGS